MTHPQTVMQLIKDKSTQTIKELCTQLADCYVCVISSHAGQCVEIVLDDDSEAFYVLNHTSLCISCDHEFVLNGTTDHQPMNVTWILGGQQIDPSEGQVLQNGTLIIFNSSKVFKMQSATLLECITGVYTATNTIMLGSRYLSVF